MVANRYKKATIWQSLLGYGSALLAFCGAITGKNKAKEQPTKPIMSGGKPMSDTNMLKQKIRKYLELENVSVLVGAGASFHLNAPTIRDIENFSGFPQETCSELKNEYFNNSQNDSEISFEDLINCLQADLFLKQKKGGDDSKIIEYIQILQNWLLKECSNLSVHDSYKEDENLTNNEYHYHEMMIKKLLQRPTNLRRANLFTTNYDMAFDCALDNLGVHYMNGFMGVHNRFFRPEVYNYDLYYPGQSVSGSVHRAEKVLKYYKLHGSLSWRATEPNVSNTYGIKEIPINNAAEAELGEKDRLVIYPCTTKESFALNLPYSELFRHFSQAINQPQSVLFCIGYSFHDDHINAIIHQALSIPSFTLVIVDYNSKNNEKIKSLSELKDARIMIVSDEIEDVNQSKFTEFVKNTLPDLYEERDNEIIAKTMKNLYPEGKQHGGNNGTQ